MPLLTRTYREGYVSLHRRVIAAPDCVVPSLHEKQANISNNRQYLCVIEDRAAYVACEISG